MLDYGVGNNRSSWLHFGNRHNTPQSRDISHLPRKTADHDNTSGPHNQDRSKGVMHMNVYVWLCLPHRLSNSNV